jgi:TnpA family transposase
MEQETEISVKRLASCTAKNRFYRANRDQGRIFKTEFLLSYLSEPQLRSRIGRGLLKVEQLHALARGVYYGRRGRINTRELHEQMNSCSCLTLILACVITGRPRRSRGSCAGASRRTTRSTSRCWSTSAPSSGTT